MRTTEKAPTILTAVGARRLTARIRDAIALADDLLVRAYEGRAWEALGHASWEAYCAAELPELRTIKLRAPARRARTSALYERGATEREIAAATGASIGTAHNDVAHVTGRSILSTPAHTPPAGPRLSNVERAVAEVAKRGAQGLTYIELCARLKWRGGQATGALSKAHTRGLIVSSGTFRDGCNAFVTPHI